MGPGGKDRSPCRDSQDETAEYQCHHFCFPVLGQIPNTCKGSETSPAHLCIRNRQALGDITVPEGTLTSWSARSSGGPGVQPTSSIHESVVRSGCGWTHWVLGDTAAALPGAGQAVSQSPACVALACLSLPAEPARVLLEAV